MYQSVKEELDRLIAEQRRREAATAAAARARLAIYESWYASTWVGARRVL